MIEERFPATSDRALKCLASLSAGLDVELNATGRTATAVCGCGHPIAARSYESVYAAMRDHLTRQVEQ